MAKVTTRQSQQAADTLVDLGKVQNSAVDFWEKYSKIIYIVVGALVVIVGGYFGYKFLVAAPKEKAAAEKIYLAERQFQIDSLDNALNGKAGSYVGLLNIINNYGGTDAGNVARLYAGITYLQKGEWDNAIKQLEGFSTSSKLFSPFKKGLLGDAYSEKGDFGKAISYYKDAAGIDNDYTAPYFLWKLGMAYEHEKNLAEAKKCYEKIKKDYPKSTQGDEAELYISRVSQ